MLRRHGWNDVIRVMTLESLGVPSTTAYARCRPGGEWRRLLPGVLALHNGPVSRLQQVSAALVYAGDHAMITGAEACRRHGLSSVADSGDAVHVLVPAARKLHSAGFVLVERTERLPAPTVRSGIPLAPPPRCVLDTCRRMSAMDPCRALLSEVLQRRMTSHRSLSEELAAGSTRGSAIPRKVLAELSSGAHSVAELRAQRLWQRAGIPPAAWNGRLYGPDGGYIASPDAWRDDVGFAWEIDSVAHHSDHAGFAATLARNARYAAAGVVVLQTLPSRLQTDAQSVIRELRAAYRAAQDRPRPAVRFVAPEEGLRAS